MPLAMARVHHATTEVNSEASKGQEMIEATKILDTTRTPYFVHRHAAGFSVGGFKRKQGWQGAQSSCPVSAS